MEECFRQVDFACQGVIGTRRVVQGKHKLIVEIVPTSTLHQQFLVGSVSRRLLLSANLACRTVVVQDDFFAVEYVVQTQLMLGRICHIGALVNSDRFVPCYN